MGKSQQFSDFTFAKVTLYELVISCFNNREETVSRNSDRSKIAEYHLIIFDVNANIVLLQTDST